ncbi:ATP-binding protein [Cohnella herbarum]|uniref:Circadian input-output histidine kinase CikA n=1 Tax=Cohnella herbarum TaxID=2728023 RepID=A0A7Z2ZM30_9BACL|nr:ATP-binding protein [Cohnella herbarum]QJD84623.1 response regulator [Cohnella herbarum]
MLNRALIISLLGLIAISLIPLSIFMNHNRQIKELTVRSGALDLSAWNPERDKRIKLDGDWEFYWGQLLSPDPFNEPGAVKGEPADLMKVPSKWNGKLIDGKPLPAHGYATYRMVLHNVPLNQTFALKKTNIRFSSAVYVNGKKLFQDGQPSEEASGYRAGNVPQIGFFSSEKEDIEIIVHVANFDYANSGIPASLYFGEQSAMLAAQQVSKAYELSTFAVLAALSFIFFLCFAVAALYRQKDYTLLFFGLLCSFYALYNGLVGERVLLMFVHGISFELIFKVKDLCSLACLVILALYFFRLKKDILSLKFTQAIIFLLGSYMIMVVFLPISTYQTIEPFIILAYESMILWLLLRTAILHIKSVSGERLKSFLLFLAVLFIVLYSVDLILFSFSLKENLWLGQVYIVLFNLIMLSLAVLRFFEAYRTVDSMKNQLLRLDKIKDDFLSNTSHELKTPLNAIVNIADSLLKGVEGRISDTQAQNLGIIVGSGRKLTYLVNELLDYSKMKHGDITLYKSGIDLKATVDSVMRIHMFLLGGRQIEIVNEVPEGFPALYADSNRLIQILHNLIGNAIKFTDRGKVSIQAAVTGDRIEIRVTDTGIGIAHSLQESIFLPFEQAAISGSNAVAGTGLGLSITKKLVELHGGDISVESTPHQGSIFTFTLPLTDSPSGMMKGEQDHSRGNYREISLVNSQYPMFVQGERDELILVVDDDSANLQTMSNLLKLEGYSFIVVNRGQSALDRLLMSHDIDLVILDIMMPDMSGYEVLQKIRERFSPFELPVLMLTANNKVEEIKLSMDNGANDFVGKPFESEELMARVRGLTRLKASVQTARNAEIAFLRSQINPHFLYNTLNSIAELCVEEPHQAEELTLQLSQYLRSSINFNQLDSLTPLDNELELVEAYVNIEKARFGARLHMEYDVDADLEIEIPPLILQPLVENAIRHGLMSNSRGGQVKLSVQKNERQEVSFSVEDNGCGMNIRKVEELLSPDGSKRGVGLWNISQRLKLLYGKSLHIESVEGRGTKVVFDIPLRPTKLNGG